MLLKNLISFALLALQAGFSGAKPLLRDERREVAIPERGPRVLPRAEHFVASGTVTGTAADTVYTSGLATCPGLAASGSPGAGGIDKVLAHISCVPADGTTFQQQMNQWVNTVHNSGMGNIKIVVDILDPSVAPAAAQQAQILINNAAKNAAQSIGRGYAVHYRHEMADPPPAGTLRIEYDGTISVGGVAV